MKEQTKTIMTMSIGIFLILVLGFGVMWDLEKQSMFMDGYCSDRYGIFNISDKRAGYAYECIIKCNNETWEYISNCGLDMIR